MALKIVWDTPYGITCNDAYAIVTDATMQKKHQDIDDEGTAYARKYFVIRYKVKIWSDEASYNAGNSFIGGLKAQFEVDIAGTKNQYNVVKQCYLDLKSQPGWENATDR